MIGRCDSFIEVTSGSALLWRMSMDADRHRREQVERRTLGAVGIQSPTAGLSFDRPKLQGHEDAIPVVLVGAEGSAHFEAYAAIQRLRWDEGCVTAGFEEQSLILAF